MRALATAFVHRASAAISVLALAVCWSVPAAADAIRLPQNLTRDGTITAQYRVDTPITGSGVLTTEWVDTTGHVVERRQIPAKLWGGRIPFSLELPRGFVAGYRLHAKLTLLAVTPSGTTFSYTSEADANMPVPMPRRSSGWSNYQVIMWQLHNELQYRALRQLGVTAGMVYSNNADKPAATLAPEVAPLLASGLRFYVEDIATDFYSAYHRPASKGRFAAIKALYQKNPADRAALVRDPSLSDPAWLARVRHRLAVTVAAERSHDPLFYNLGDETGIADLSVAWDFDFSPASLAGFREYLRQRYGTLAALNHEWGAEFTAWDQIVPPTTKQAMNRTDGNFAGWGDFKTWMDVAFAAAVRQGTDAIHAADPHAIAAIEGAQDSGWGGYDYTHLATAVDLVEIYDGGENMAALRSFNPNMVLLTTLFGGGPTGIHELWREFFRGARGVILWDPNNEIVEADGTVGPWGKDLAPTWTELENGVAAQLIVSEPVFDSVGILYSPASLRTRWLLDWQPKGDAWSARSANDDYDDPNEVRTAMNDALQALWHHGVAPRFLTDDKIAQGVLARDHYRVLILPQSIALSAAASEQIAAFVHQGGVAIADGVPGWFNEHSRRLAAPQLINIFGAASQPAQSKVAPGQSAAIQLTPAMFAGTLPGLVNAAGAGPGFVLATANGWPTDVEMHRWRNGDVTIVSLLRSGGPVKPEPASEVVNLTLSQPAYVYDLRAGTALGHVQQLPVTLGRVTPVLLAISSQSLPALEVEAPQRIQSGTSVEVGLNLARSLPTTSTVVHIAVVRPDGSIARNYSGNVIIHDGRGTWAIPFAVYDATGWWQVRAIDRLSGQTVTRPLEVR